jgi:hypothetical protein
MDAYMPCCTGSCGLLWHIIYLNGLNGRELGRSVCIWPLQPFLVDLQQMISYGYD